MTKNNNYIKYDQLIRFIYENTFRHIKIKIFKYTFIIIEFYININRIYFN